MSDPLPVASLRGCPPFVRGTLQTLSPLRRGTAVERSDRQGVAHKPCSAFRFRNHDAANAFLADFPCASESSGAVMKVVVRAIKTRMAKTRDESMPRS